MKIKEQTRKLATGCTCVRQGDVDAVWIWFSKSMKSTEKASSHLVTKASSLLCFFFYFNFGNLDFYLGNASIFHFIIGKDKLFVLAD